MNLVKVRLLNPKTNHERQAIKNFGDTWWALDKDQRRLVLVGTHETISKSAQNGDARWWDRERLEILDELT